MIIKIERSPTDLVLYDLTICGIKEITEVIEAIKPSTTIILLNITYYTESPFTLTIFAPQADSFFSSD